MYVLLKVKVPDNFKKGDYKNCPFSRGLFEKWCVVRSSFPFLLKCTAEDCPLKLVRDHNS